MHSTRYITLLWPGLPWLWFRGSIAGLVLATAFAVILDVALLLSWVWSDLAAGNVVLAVWAAAAGVWAVATLSAVTTFPPPLPTGRDEAAEALFVAARDAYLARDWLAAETKLRGLLLVSPTDGEAQLLLGTLLRRAGRKAESRAALERLARSDAGRPWLAVIAREVQRLDADDSKGDAVGPAAEEAPSIITLGSRSDPGGDGVRTHPGARAA